MIGAKNQASQRPTAMGTMLQASTYGATIPSIIGRTMSPALAIWAANLRQGGSVKKFKQMKKGLTAYVENIDFLLGHNPARNVLQLFVNGGKYPLAFTSQTFTASGGRASFTVADPYFYAVVGVTLTQNYSAVFRDYGSAPSTAFNEAHTVPSATPYTVTVTNAAAFDGDLGVKYAVAPGNSLKKVTTPPATGQYNVNPSTGVYTFAAGDAGAAINISYTYGSILSGSYEVPLWNELETGGNPTDPMSYRHWPFCYRWSMGSGATINVDPESFPSGTLKVYYAQLMQATSYLPPLQKMRLAFEAVLGSGTEYSGFSSQQIQYPQFFGMGSSDIDLGSSGTLPQINSEVAGKWGLYSTGDADFVDMIEDTVKSGLAQAAIGQGGAFPPTTQLERGCSGYGFPGTIQKKVDQSTTVALPPMLYDMPNSAGNLLVAQVASAGALAIASSNGETWTKVLDDGLGYQVWTAAAIGGPPNNVTVSGATGTAWAMNLMEIGGATSMDSAGIGFAAGSASAYFFKNGVYVFSNNQIDAVFSNFALSGTLPGDAVIQGIYPVVKVTSPLSYSGGFFFLNATHGSFGGWSATAPAAGEYYAPSVGNTLASMAATTITAGINDTVVNGSHNPCRWIFGGIYQTPSQFQVEVGYAIYYTSATPAIDPYLPPPFAVPAGQGLAWALPTQTVGSFPPTYLDNCGTWSNGAGGNASASNGKGGFVGQKSAPNGGSFTVTPSGGVSVDSSVTPGFPAYLLSLPYYSGGAPAGMDVQQWDHLTPANVFGKTPGTIQAHGRVIRNPGTYSIAEPGSPGQTVVLSLQSTQPATFPKPVGDFMDRASMDLTRLQCRAYGLWGSVTMNSQQSAADWLKTFYAAANAAPCFYGFKLYSLPYAEQSTAGNGAVYTAPTASGPVADLSTELGDILKGIEVVTASRNDMPNVLQMQHPNRNSNYNPVTVSQPEAASIALYGVRKQDPIVNHAVQDPAISRALLGVAVRRNQYGSDSYKFALNARWSLLAPMDLVTITDPLVGISKLPVRITRMAEQQDGSFDCVAKPFVYRMESPTPFVVTPPSPYQPSTGNSAGNVNAPVIFEPVARLFKSANQGELWVAVSSNNANYGGAQVYISTDGGSSYNPAGDPLTGSAITGVTTASWAASSSPDTTNDLPLDLTESNGTLLSYATSDEDNFLYPCYVAGGGSAIPYELMTYAIATLTSANKYTLKATGAGNHLDRGVFGAPSNGAGVVHPSGSRFLFIPPSMQGILRLPLDPNWVGKTLWFKVLSFNTFGAAQQSLSDVTAYSYTVLGSSGSGAFTVLVNGA